MKLLNETERNNWYKYHIPNTSRINKVKINAVFLRAANSWKHEQAKCRYAYELIKAKHKIITEAEDNKTGKIRDLVDISTGLIFEFETDKKRAERHTEANVKVIMV